MATEVRAFTFFVDSKYRKRGEAYHPYFGVDPKIQLSNPNNYFEFECKTADIPFSFHTLDIPNNQLQMAVTVPHHGVSTSVTITIPAGNYSILQLNDALSQRFSAALISLGFVNQNQRPKLGIVYDETTSKDTFYLYDAPNEDWTIVFQWTGSDILAEYFGFDYTLNTTLYAYQGGGVSSTNGTSINVVNVSPITSLYLRSDTFDQTITNQEVLVESVATTSSILAQMPISFSYMTWIFYSTSDLRIKLQNQEIAEFDLYFTGLTYDEIRFRGAHWKMMFVLREMRPDWLIEMDKSMAAQQREAQLQLQLAETKKRELTDAATSRMGKIRKRLESKKVD